MVRIKEAYNSLSPIGQFGVVTQGFGALSGGLGAFYATDNEIYKTKSLALSLQHKKDMNLFNLRQKNAQARYLSKVFNQQLQILSLAQGAAKSKAKTSFAARGIQLGVGSTRDAFVSSEILATIDKLTMNSNKVRAIENKRLEGVGLGIQANMLGVSERNMFATASSIDPFMNMSSSLLTGASSLINSLPANIFTKKG
tara:strand:+ start:2369 stop:2962 length:594 start_codon:yes stop_codon:yes gene_type:complete